jgi:uroporphyrinogen-III synthase
MAGEESLEARGWKFSHHDFIQKRLTIPKPLTSELKENIVLTSQMGFRAFVEIIVQNGLNKSNFSVFCTSQTTYQSVLSAGLSIKGVAHNAELLANEILKNRMITSVTFIAGNRRRDELPQVLRQHGVAVHEVMAYRTDLTPITIAEAFEGIVFFSPSAIDSFLLLNRITRISCFCIGQTTARYAQQKGFESALVAENPTEEAMVSLLNHHFSKPSVHAQE